MSPCVSLFEKVHREAHRHRLASGSRQTSVYAHTAKPPATAHVFSLSESHAGGTAGPWLMRAHAVSEAEARSKHVVY